MKVKVQNSRKLIAAGTAVAVVAVFSLGTAAALTPAGNGWGDFRRQVRPGRTAASGQRTYHAPRTSPAEGPPHQNVQPATAASANARPQRRVEHVNEVDFHKRVLQSGQPVLVDFYADWCQPCRKLAPVLEKVAQETPHAKVVKVNVDRNPRLAAKYGIRSLPSLMVFHQGKVTARHVGLANPAGVRKLLDAGQRQKNLPVSYELPNRR